ncbi:rhodanese-like domain-containing protein [Romboutsia sp. 1001713B170131_170501_G6]|uniref:rhodanese-like domain-containing protein n=1 Tax=Romboutsia sp. 1001713B170131_170501_G6 TaxID=2787108 RepID=UPI0018AAB476|nr:rhodanese-like domain-containing protein [Romboutsia sp. 1001713B170131_170501_G6]
MSIYILDSERIKSMIDNNEFDLIIDIRNEEYYLNGHLPKAINIPMNEINDKIDFLADYKDKKILLYCGIGSQSKAACKVLSINGFNKLYSLFGGIKDYKYELEK